MSCRAFASSLALLLAATAFTLAPAGATTTPAVPGGVAVPIPTKGPAWFDRAYFDQVIAAGPRGVRVPAAASVPNASGLTAPGIHPGSWLVTLMTDPFGEIGFAWCSANFVFRKVTSSGTLYGIGTAGHCAAKDALGGFADVTAYVVPPSGLGQAGFFHIGKFVLSRNGGIGDDFALVQIYPRYRSWLDPTMPTWGGPVGTYKSTSATVVEWFGNAAGFGAGGTPRAGYAPVWTAAHGNAFAWVGPSFEGDSGSGVITQSGAAAGDLTHMIAGTPPIYGQPYPMMMAGTKMSRILQIARGWTLLNGGAPTV